MLQTILVSTNGMTKYIWNNVIHGRFTKIKYLILYYTKQWPLYREVVIIYENFKYKSSIKKRILAPPQNQVNQTPTPYPLHFSKPRPFLVGVNSGRGLGKVEGIIRGVSGLLGFAGVPESPFFCYFYRIIILISYTIRYISYTSTIDNIVHAL